MRVLVGFLLVTQLDESSGWTIAVVLTSATFLVLGFATPIVAVLTGVMCPGLAFSTLEVIEIVVLTAAIALLGPGAYSIDARLFGRREVFIP